MTHVEIETLRGTKQVYTLKQAQKVLKIDDHRLHQLINSEQSWRGLFFKGINKPHGSMKFKRSLHKTIGRNNNVYLIERCQEGGKIWFEMFMYDMGVKTYISKGNIDELEKLLEIC